MHLPRLENFSDTLSLPSSCWKSSTRSSFLVWSSNSCGSICVALCCFVGFFSSLFILLSCWRGFLAFSPYFCSLSHRPAEKASHFDRASFCEITVFSKCSVLHLLSQMLSQICFLKAWFYFLNKGVPQPKCHPSHWETMPTEKAPLPKLPGALKVDCSISTFFQI